MNELTFDIKRIDERGLKLLAYCREPIELRAMQYIYTNYEGWEYTIESKHSISDFLFTYTIRIGDVLDYTCNSLLHANVYNAYRDSTILLIDKYKMKLLMNYGRLNDVSYTTLIWYLLNSRETAENSLLCMR